MTIRQKMLVVFFGLFFLLGAAGYRGTGFFNDYFMGRALAAADDVSNKVGNSRDQAEPEEKKALFSGKRSQVIEIKPEVLDHPFFHTQEYLKFLADEKAYQEESLALDLEAEQLQERMQKQAPMTGFLVFFLEVMTSLTSFRNHMIYFLISIILVIFYFIYLKKCNPLKWHLIFKTKNLMKLVSDSIKRSNKIPIIIAFIICFQAGSANAGTTIFTDIKYYLFGKQLEQGYITIKYPKPVNKLDYEEANNIRIFQEFKRGSFENYYNYVVHEYVLDIDITELELKSLVESCKTNDQYEISYAIIFLLSDSKIKDFVKNRVRPFPYSKVLLENRIAELTAMINHANNTNKIAMLYKSVLPVLEQLIVEAEKTNDLLSLALLLKEFESDKDMVVWNKIKFRFKDIIESENNMEMFKKTFSNLMKNHDLNELYDFEEVKLEVSGLNNDLQVKVASLFDSINDKIAKDITLNLDINMVYSLKDKDKLNLVTVMSKYRKDDNVILYALLISDFFNRVEMAPTKSWLPGFMEKKNKRRIVIPQDDEIHMPIFQFMKLASILGYNREEVIRDLIAKDLDLFGEKVSGSALLPDADFMRFLSDEEMERNMNFFKKRPQNGKVVLDELLERNHELFLELLNYLYAEFPSIIANEKFKNKLFDFENWNKFFSEETLVAQDEISCLYYVLYYQLYERSNGGRGIASSTEPILEDIFKDIIIDGELNENKAIEAIKLHHFIKQAKTDRLNDARELLEKIIDLRLKDKVAKRTEEFKAELETKKADLAQVREVVDKVDREQIRVKVEAIILLILTIIIMLYCLITLILSIKHALLLTLPYTENKFFLFFMSLVQTYSFFMMPVLYFTFQSIFAVLLVQAYGFLRSQDGYFPNGPRAMDFINVNLEKVPDVSDVPPEDLPKVTDDQPDSPDVDTAEADGGVE